MVSPISPSGAPALAAAAAQPVQPAAQPHAKTSFQNIAEAIDLTKLDATQRQELKLQGSIQDIGVYEQNGKKYCQMEVEFEVGGKKVRDKLATNLEFPDPATAYALKRCNDVLQIGLQVYQARLQAGLADATLGNDVMHEEGVSFTVACTDDGDPIGAELIETARRNAQGVSQFVPVSKKMEPIRLKDAERLKIPKSPSKHVVALQQKMTALRDTLVTMKSENDLQAKLLDGLLPPKTIEELARLLEYETAYAIDCFREAFKKGSVSDEKAVIDNALKQLQTLASLHKDAVKNLAFLTAESQKDNKAWSLAPVERGLQGYKPYFPPAKIAATLPAAVVSAAREVIGCTIVPSQPSGNCFYEAVANCLGDGQTAGDLRAKAYEKCKELLKENNEGFKEKLRTSIKQYNDDMVKYGSKNRIDESDLQGYVERIRGDKFWAGPGEIHALSIALSLNIKSLDAAKVHDRTKAFSIGASEDPKLRVIYLDYQNRNHWNAVLANKGT